MREIKSRYDIITRYVNTILDQIDMIEEESRTPLKYTQEQYGAFFVNKNFRTIKLSIPRQQGNSQIAYELLKKLPESCLFLDKHKHMDNFFRKYFIEKERMFCRVDKMYGQHFNYVVVDMASYIDERELDMLFHLKDVKFFILLG